MSIVRTALAAPTRRALLWIAAVTLAASPLAACSKPGAPAAGAVGRENTLGKADAPVTLVEYASVTCPHCRDWHDKNWSAFKAKYVDTGKVRFIFRELPTPPAALSTAGFLVARAAPPDRYFDVLDVLFNKQIALYQAYQQSGTAAKDELSKIAHTFGLSDAQFEAAIQNQAEIERIRKISEDAGKFDVTGTPSFVINGKTYTVTAENNEMDMEHLSKIIDPLLGSKGAGGAEG
jgi:protein-disulfide isomerase